MFKPALLLGLLAATVAMPAAAQQPPQVMLRGTVVTGSGEHPAWFTLICTQGTGGALSLQLMLGADTAPDFPFDAYEGPRAPAATLPSAQFEVGAQRFAPTQVAGWFSGDKEGAFVFGVATAVGKRDTATDVAAALGQPHATLRWIQLGNDLQTPPLVATFTPDAQQSHALQHVAQPCLPRHG
ncbi:hypothetical protein [Dyella acidiphila]|uniref:Uncharacterized protein n=1 Tax=Dyella acidiphila TaxID=2775866 RepID=A0ABR9G921_9GAMM|nr:hypothetical protein [Dyella acidiphila]MBE1160548.1 hypothetical protein [Dyella acidiphila]